VTAVVCAALDEASDGEVRRRIAGLRGDGLPVESPPRHRPHITLGAVSVPGEELDAVLAVVEELASRHLAFRVRLGHLGIFPGGGVLWLAPEPSAPLRSLQADTDRSLAAAGYDRAFGDQSYPDHWVAHVTLATRLDAATLARAVRVSAQRFRPVTGRITGLMTILLGRRGEEILVPLPG
jgi:2'-5' RNA ligase